MKATKNLTYRVVVEKEKYKDGSTVYVSQVPTLGISDYGPTIEEALDNTQKLIKFHIESLIEEGEEVPGPDDANNIIVTNSEVSISSNRKLVLT
ncbi:MAG: hypothetical protein ACD_83C00291G0005 [uncultured bacterium]|uniref:HicB-like antitoxin of toxin-antitoxin system domain-containing protein n=1 Tax=Berkelbacteria bacterium GW2011_GWA2_38_9 TaxID=1618334 RepID=A0A0G0PJ34_9BACT|nr:MAG: hypothetical protein ACD_83C00291G0005 [uncultured bacterium]KKQ89346.1 MAG: hypothetical protein UT11_C0028G0006 [Berkelbacteria bacterium GW2011_GWA2_38_9]